jgi:magnesium transporter
MQPVARLILPEIKDLLASPDLDELQATLEHLHPADIADLIQELDDQEARQLFMAVPEAERTAVFEHLEEEHQERLLNLVGPAALGPVLEEMASDDRADFLQSLPSKVAETLIRGLPREEQRDVASLVQYPEQTAGAIMTSEFAAVPVEATVAQALDHLRRVAPHRETIYYVYVTDPERHLLGVLSLKDLVLADPETPVAEIMEKDVISVPVDMDQEDVASEMAKYDFLAMPVVDPQNRLVGIITHDDIIDVIEEETTEDTQRIGAVTPLTEGYLQTGFWPMVRKRGVWLGLLFLAEMVTGAALHHFEETIRNLAILVAFMPLINSSGGNAGSQSAVLVIRSLAVGDVQLRDWARIMWRETWTGLALGVFLAIIGMVRALLWNTGPGVALVVGVTLVCIVLWGSLLGALLPLLMRRVGLDPAAASSPFVASLVDISGVLIYFSIAEAFLFA